MLVIRIVQVFDGFALIPFALVLCYSTKVVQEGRVCPLASCNGLQHPQLEENRILLRRIGGPFEVLHNRYFTLANYMTTIRRFTCDDLFTFNSVNLDYFTETVRL